MDLRRELNCAWLGPSCGGLGWLLQRVRDFRPAGRKVNVMHESAGIEVAAVQSICRAGVDRVILGCNSRVQYPAEAIDCLQCEFPDVPFAVATDNWWDGSRRTGIGTANHLLLPWYRWWDTWADWLAGRPAHLFGPCIAATAACHRRETSVGLSNDNNQRGLIIANCRQQGLGWVLAALASGSHSTAMSKQMFYSGSPHAEPAWVLWDDSCLDTTYGPVAEGQLLEFFSYLRRTLPGAVGIAAMCMPRFDQWQGAREVGARELIAKPNSGRALSQCLDQIFSLACSSAALART